MSELSFTLEKDLSSKVSLLKLQNASWELNVRLNEDELNQLKSLKVQPESLRAGKAADAEVFWHLDEKNLFIMVGYDDQSWDFSVTIPVKEAQQFLADLNNR